MLKMLTLSNLFTCKFPVSVLHCETLKLMQPGQINFLIGMHSVYNQHIFLN